MRKLASVQKIASITPIPERDRIVLAQVCGWNVIVRKDEYAVGDRCVYVEIDSVLPEKPEFEFLRSKKFRIKTMKMGGCISQGICFPLSILPKDAKKYAVGDDVTEILGVTQYQPTMDTEQNEKGTAKPRSWWKRIWMSMTPKYRARGTSGFPNFISKTDETRIQNAPQMLQDKEPYVATEKIDGQSGTFALVRHKSRIPFWKDRFEYIVCSRNRRLWEKDNSSYWAVSERYRIEAALRNMIGDKEWIAIQGECIAPKVQNNKYKVAEPDLYVFNLIAPNGRYGSLIAKSIIEQHGMKFVPIIEERYTLPDTVQETLEYAHGQSAIGETLREGIVFRSQDGKKSFKAVDPLFLMQYDE